MPVAIPSAQVTQLALDALDLKPGDKLLEIGTGTGFQTQYWAQEGVEVHSIELHPIVDPDRWPGTQVYLHGGDGRLGLPQESPFSAIVATCGCTEIPRAWEEQLGEGGRMVVPIGSAEAQRLVLYDKSGRDNLRPVRVLGYCRFQMME